MVSSVSSFIASSNIGLIPYIMTNMALSLVPALDYIWLHPISAAPFTLAYLYMQGQSANNP